MLFRSNVAWLLLFAACAVAGCKKKADAASAPSASAAAPRAPVGKGDPKRALATPAAPTVTRLVHTKITKDECTFDLDAPEVLAKTGSDGVSVSYAGKLVSFQGFAGASLDDFDLAASSDKPEDTLYYDKAGDPQLVVARIPTASEPLNAVMGSGNEKKPEDRKSGLGCSFICTGTKAAEGDAVAMCRSVKITYDAKKAE
jgi:hypothetical protein